MEASFTSRLGAGDTLVADGATGTNYQARGLPPGVSPEHWLFERPEEVVRLHRAFVEAGSDIILTCSFGGNAFRLHGTPYADRVHDLNQRAVSLAREAAAAAQRSIFVAGSMGPTGGMLEPLGDLTREAVIEAYAVQAEALAGAGVDLLVLETFFAIEEARAAVAGVQSASDLPLVCSFSYDRGLRTMMGVKPEDMAAAIAPLGVVAFGANCGTTLENMEQIVRELVQHAGGLPVWAKPNAGQPAGPHADYPVRPDEMAAQARRLVNAGAQIVGGCCGSTPEHIRAIVQTMHESAQRKPQKT